MGIFQNLLLVSQLALPLAALNLGERIKVNRDVSAASAGDATDLVPDGKTCCPSGQEPTAYADQNDRCEYGSHISQYISPSDDKVTKCCYDVGNSKFYAHYLDLDHGLHFPLDIHGSKQYQTELCNLGLKYDITEGITSDNWFSLKINLNVDCITYNASDEEWITVLFNEDYRHAGKFTYVISAIGPTIYADISTKVISNDTIGYKIHVSGTGVAGRVEKTVTDTYKSSNLTQLLGGKEIC